MSFRGTFEHSLDAKHRLTVPAKFRAPLAGGVVLSLQPEVGDGSPRCVGIWPAPDFESFVAAVLAGQNPASPQARELKRYFYNNSFDTELDSANRVMVPPTLMRDAGLTKDLVVVGSGEVIEVFDRPAFYGYRDDVIARIPDITARLGDPA